MPTKNESPKAARAACAKRWSLSYPTKRQVADRLLLDRSIVVLLAPTHFDGPIKIFLFQFAPFGHLTTRLTVPFTITAVKLGLARASTTTFPQ